MSTGRYMAYSPSPSTTPHSPRISGLRAPSAAVAEQEKYLAELLAERHKLGPFIPVIPHSVRLLNQEILRVSTLLENASLLNQSGLEHGSPLTTGGLYSNGAATDMTGWTSAFQSESSPAYSWLGGSQGSSSGLIVKKTMKVDIPVDKYPTYNFVGRILGPRGNSLKRVEANTDCRVLIRGRGSIKDPAQEEMMRGKPGYEHLNEPLHILVEAELPVEIIDARLMQTREILEDLLKPVDESQDFFKKQQLRELAMLNSTLHEEGMQGSSLSGTDSDVIERDLLQPPSGDSSGAVRNAAQAAPMIHDEVFRVRKKAAQCEDVKVSLTDEHTKLDIEQILKEAQHRWLRPAEICEILKNYRNFRIAPEPPNRPPSGSLFLFERKVLRFFRKDGHNWRKKNDQKTVKEAHERLKSGSIDVLHCYYAHGEENINFQRRTYWMLEEDFMHIVLVHYLETKGGKSSRTRAKNNMIQDAAADSPLSQLPSRTRGGESSLCRQAPEYEEAESEYLKQNSVQRIFIQEPPDIALSIGRSRTKVELDP